MNQNFTQFAFTPSVRAEQEKFGSRTAYARMENSGDRFLLTEQEIPFIESRDGFYMATVNLEGWPYMQFRGGPKGFLKVLDNRTLGIADFRGNRQYLSVGNLRDNEKAHLFLMDYANRERLKIWVTSTIVERDENPQLLEELRPKDYRATVERGILFTIQAYDWNCPQHITPRYTLEEIEAGIRDRDPDLLRTCCPDRLPVSTGD